MVEAAGIEPASRDIFMEASTRVVGRFERFRLLAPCRQGASLAIRERGLVSGVPDVTRDDPDLLAGLWGSPAKPLGRGYVFLRSQDEVILGN